MKRQAVGHTKMKKLCRRLNVGTYVGVGILESVWHLTAREAAIGDLGRLSNEDIAIAIDYKDDPDELVEALVESGWLDKSATYRLVVHDWAEHADDATKKAITRKGLKFADLSIQVGTFPYKSGHSNDNHLRINVSGNVETNRDIYRLPEPEPEPEPVPVPLAEPTKPDNEKRQQQPRYEPFTEPDRTQMAKDLVSVLAAVHPVPGNISLAGAAVEKILMGAVDAAAVSDAVRKSHKDYLTFWREARSLNPRYFIPQLHRWFNDEDYLHPPIRDASTPGKSSPTSYYDKRLKELEEEQSEHGE